jgi:hypothetical protein
MRLSVVLVAAFPIFLLLDACSAYRGSFTDDSPSMEAGAPPNNGCARVAARRADDAVMAFYVEQGSPGEREVYQATYRACLDWANSH